MLLLPRPLVGYMVGKPHTHRRHSLVYHIQACLQERILNSEQTPSQRLIHSILLTIL